MIYPFIHPSISEYILVRVICMVNQSVDPRGDLHLRAIDVYRILIKDTQGNRPVITLAEHPLLPDILSSHPLNIYALGHVILIKLILAEELLKPNLEGYVGIAATIETPLLFQLFYECGKILRVQTLYLVFENLQSRLILITVLVYVVHFHLVSSI